MPRSLLFALAVSVALIAIAAALAVDAPAQTTNPLPPVATSSAATSLVLTSATVSGTVDANGSATTWYVEYGTTTAHGLKTATLDAGAREDPVAVSVDLTGLTERRRRQLRSPGERRAHADAEHALQLPRHRDERARRRERAAGAARGAGRAR